jgi:excisionase family DNA binding protein
MPEFPERYLSPNEVAQRLNVTPLTVRRWLTSGKLKGLRAGRLWRVRESDLDAFLQGSGREQAEKADRGE